MWWRGHRLGKTFGFREQTPVHLCVPQQTASQVETQFPHLAKVEPTPPTYLQGATRQCQAISIVPITQEVLNKRFLCVLMRSSAKFDSFSTVPKSMGVVWPFFLYRYLNPRAGAREGLGFGVVTQ